MKNEEREKLPPRKFDSLLAGLDDGAVVTKIGEELLVLMNETLEVARSRGQAGSAIGTLNIKLAFKVEANGEIEIHADHSTKAPKMPRALTRRWLDPKTMEIVDANPRQMGLPLREALPTTSELRSV
jgi:hypothetical protein